MSSLSNELPESLHSATDEELEIIFEGIEKEKDRNNNVPDINSANYDSLKVGFSKQGNFTNAVVLDTTDKKIFVGTAKRHAGEDPFIPERGKQIALIHLAMKSQAISL